MSRKCDICGKKTTVGCNVSHAHNVSKRKVYPNLQKVRTVIDGKTVRVTACTRCIKSGKIVKPVKVVS